MITGLVLNMEVVKVKFDILGRVQSHKTDTTVMSRVVSIFSYNSLQESK